MRVESRFCLIEIRHLSINLAMWSSGSDAWVPVSPMGWDFWERGSWWCLGVFSRGQGFWERGSWFWLGVIGPGRSFWERESWWLGFRGRCTYVTVINVHRDGVLNWGDHRWGRGVKQGSGRAW